MTTDHEELRAFQEAYMDYVEGDRDAPPPLDNLAGEQRRAAETFVETIKAARGIDPSASRPPLEQLLESGSDVAIGSNKLGNELQHHLRKTVDPNARVTVDSASGATGLGSSWVIQARGIRMRVVEEGSENLDSALARRAGDIARVFGTYPDCQAVLYTTGGQDPRGVVLVRGDVYGAIETPSGEERPPRLPRSVLAAAMACEQWLRGLIPEFKPLSRDLLKGATAVQSPSLDALELAGKVVKEVSGFGARARIEAKRETWGRFGGREAKLLAALVEDARSGRLSPDSYRSRVDELSGMAA